MKSTEEKGRSKQSITQRTLVGTAWLFLWRFLTRSLGIVSTIILARILDPIDFGLYAMALAFSLGVESLTQLGLQEALVRRRDDGFELHNTAFTMQVGRSIFTAAVIIVCSPLAAWWFSEPRLSSILAFLALVTAISGFENVGVAEFRRSMNFSLHFKLMTIPRFAGVLCTILIALLWRSYWALLWGSLVSAALKVFLSYLYHPFRPILKLDHWKTLANFSSWTWAAAIASVVWDRCDPFILGPSFGSAKLGLYLLAMQIALIPLTEFVSPAAEALFAGFSRAQMTGSSSVHHSSVVAGIIVIGIAPIVLGLSAASGPLLEVMLTSKWEAAGPIVSVLSWVCVLSPFSYVCSVALVANGHVKRNFSVNALASAVKLVAYLFVTNFTQDAVSISFVKVACVAVEALAFSIVMNGVSPGFLRSLLGPTCRISLSIGAAALVLWYSELGWQGGTGTFIANVFLSALVGSISLLTILSATFFLWVVSGRPAGPEQRILDITRMQLERR